MPQTDIWGACGSKERSASGRKRAWLSRKAQHGKHKGCPNNMHKIPEIFCGGIGDLCFLRSFLIGYPCDQPVTTWQQDARKIGRAPLSKSTTVRKETSRKTAVLFLTSNSCHCNLFICHPLVLGRLFSNFLACKYSQLQLSYNQLKSDPSTYVKR